MSDPTTATAEQPLPFAQLLAHIAGRDGGDRMKLRELSARLRDRSWGGMLLIFAAINLLPLPPGTTTVTGIPLIVITAQMAWGRRRPWFPRKLDDRGIGKPLLAKLATKLAPWERRIARLIRPRLCWMTNHRGTRVIGAIGLLLSAILWLPIPLGNHAPALALTFYALGLIYRDGVLVIAGLLTTIGSLFLVSVTFAAAWWAALQLWAHAFGA